VLEEAHNAQKLRQMAPAPRLKEQGYDASKRELLTVEDLQKALEEVSSSREQQTQQQKGQQMLGGERRLCSMGRQWCGGSPGWQCISEDAAAVSQGSVVYARQAAH
jgi:hypothetical protein